MTVLNLVSDEMTIEEVQEKLWSSLPSIMKLRAKIMTSATNTNTDTFSTSNTNLTNTNDNENNNNMQDITNNVNSTSVIIKSASVSFLEMKELMKCLFMACHTNPISDDVEKGVENILAKLENKKERKEEEEEEEENIMYTFDNFIQLLSEVESQWLEWADMKQKWLALTEKQHASVLKELMECVIQDVEPFALLQPSQVLTLQSEIVHTKTLITPFEEFVDFVKIREFPEIYDILWNLLTKEQEEQEETINVENIENKKTNNSNKKILTLEKFTEFFNWFYLQIFINATEDAASVAAKTIWFKYLNPQGIMMQKQFVEACKHMCRQYGIEKEESDVQCLEKLYYFSEENMKKNVEEDNKTEKISLFKLRVKIPNLGKMLIDPNDLYIPEELDEIKQEMERYISDASPNRIIIYGKKGIGKTTLANNLSKRLNCVNLSIEELSIDAMDKAKQGNDDTLGIQLLKYVENNSSIPLSLIAALIKRKMMSDETVYRGYVLSDFPTFYTMEESSEISFIKECGILDVLVPNILVHLNCDDEFQIERFNATNLEFQNLQKQEIELREVAKNEELKNKLLNEKIEELQNIIKNYEVLSKEDSSTVDSELLESTKTAAANAEIELPKLLEEQKNNVEEESLASVERLKHIRELTLKRIIKNTLYGKENTEDKEEILITEIPCFKFIVERLQVLQHCLTIGCTSLVEDSISYIIETLQLKSCILPRDISKEHELNNQEENINPSYEKELEEAKVNEETAANIGAILSHRWKRFCPVTFKEFGILIEGSAKYGCVFRQKFYYLVSEENLNKFKANPILYLGATPLDGKPIFIISTIHSNSKKKIELESNMKNLLHILHEQLKLTPVEFNDFVERWNKHSNLKQLRSQALSERAKYEVTERKQRAERLKKRKAAEKKLMKKPKPPPKGRKSRKSTLLVTPKQEEEEEFKGWEKPTNIPETITSRILKTVEEEINRRKTFVPILVHALGDISIEDFNLLLSEGVLPETVIVLQSDENLEDENELNDSAILKEEDGEAEDGEKLNNVKPQIPQLKILEELESRTNTGSGKTAEVSTEQFFTIHHFNMDDKDASILALEILQLICPGVSIVEDGNVDENLEEEENILGEEGESEMEYDEENEDEEGFIREPINLALRPGKKFLNQFGTRLNYCPVTLYEKGLLLRGRNELCLQYRQKLYLFTSEEAKTKFELNPLRYLNNPPPYIPPRIWMVGYSKSGKKTLAKSLSEKYNIPFFSYDRGFFEKCIEATREPGGKVIEGIHIPQQNGNNSYLLLAESILKDLREFAEDQERRLQLRKEAEAIMERRAEAEERENDEDEEDDEIEEEKEELDEEAEARLQEQLEFEPEDDQDREVRLSEAYLKIASCVTRIEPFESQGYVMVCPPFSEGDIEVLFSIGGIPEVAVQVELSSEIYQLRHMKETNNSPPTLITQTKLSTKVKLDELRKKWLEKEERKKERELRKWRRRHIGKDDPESEPEEENEDDVLGGELNENNNNPEDNDEDNGKVSEMDQNVEQEALAEFTDAITERSVKLISLNGDLSENAVFRTAIRKLFRYLEHRRSLLYAPEIVKFDDALKMLETGEADISYFGNIDPVTLYDERHGVRRICKWKPDGTKLESEPGMENSPSVSPSPNQKEENNNNNNNEKQEEENEEDDDEEHHQEEEKENQKERSSILKGQFSTDFSDNNNYDEDEEMSEHGTEEMEEILETYKRRERREWLRKCQRTVLFCGKLYFFDNDMDLLRFKRDPLLFVQQPPPLPKLMSNPIISIYDKIELSGKDERIKKRCIADHIAYNLNCPIISLPKLLSWAAVNSSLLSLSHKAIEAVINNAANDELIEKLLGHRLNTAEVKKKGAILLNLPRTINQYNHLLKLGIKIDKIFKFDNIYNDVTELINSTTTSSQSFSTPRDSIAALTEITECIEIFIKNEGRLILSKMRGFPMSMENTYHTISNIETHLSPYRWFCPYSWSVKEILLDQYSNRYHGVYFLDNYYFFSSIEFMKQFLLYPSELTVPPGLKPLPEILPSRVDSSNSKEEYTLELLGCCPVSLYDTRENKGLRGVIEPVAKKGNLNYIVEYNNKYYALFDEDALNRFLMKPWQFIEAATLPPTRKCPLPEGETFKTINEEDFMRRTLYDPVARALIAVAEARPKYPGLTLEESALKFIALHMKCFNDKNTEIQEEQYKENFEVFRKRATLYKTMTEVSEDAARGSEFLELCKEWEKAKDDNIGKVSTLVHLRPSE